MVNVAFEMDGIEDHGADEGPQHENLKGGRRNLIEHGRIDCHKPLIRGVVTH